MYRFTINTADDLQKKASLGADRVGNETAGLIFL